MRKRELGYCNICKRKLFIEPETGLCVMCEIENLKQKLHDRDLQLAQLRREKQLLYEKLSRERADNVR